MSGEIFAFVLAAAALLGSLARTRYLELRADGLA